MSPVRSRTSWPLRSVRSPTDSASPNGRYSTATSKSQRLTEWWTRSAALADPTRGCGRRRASNGQYAVGRQGVRHGGHDDELATSAMENDALRTDALGVATDCADAVVGVAAALRPSAVPSRSRSKGRPWCMCARSSLGRSWRCGTVAGYVCAGTGTHLASHAGCNANLLAIWPGWRMDSRQGGVPRRPAITGSSRTAPARSSAELGVELALLSPGPDTDARRYRCPTDRRRRR